MAFRKERLAELAALTAILAFAITSVKSFFRPGIPPGWDHPPHLVCSYLTAEFFLPQLTVLGWDPYNNFGWVFNQFYNPGAYLLVSAVRYASFKRLDIITSYKLALVITYVLPAIGAFCLAKAMGGGPLAAALAALLSVVVTPGESEWLDAGLKQLYYIGMWPHRLGVGFALLALAAEWSALNAQGWGRLRRAAAAAALAAAAVLSHLMTGIALLVAETLTGAVFVVKRFVEQEGGLRARVVRALPSIARDIAAYAVSVGGALGLLAFWAVPLSSTNQAYHSLPTITWYVGPRGAAIFLGSLGPIALTLLLLSIAASCAHVRRDQIPVAATAAASALLMWLLSATSPFDGYIGLRLALATALFALVAVLSRMPGPAAIASVASALLLIATGPDSFKFQLLQWSVDLGKLLPMSEEYAYYKFAGLARYSAFVASALGASFVLEKAYSGARRLKGAEAQLGYAGVGVALLLLVATVVAPHLQMTDFYYPYSETLVFKMDTDFPDTAKLVRIIEWVNASVPDNTYVFYQDTLWKLGDWYRLPVSHYFYLSSMLTGKPQVGGCFGTRYITHPLANTEADHLLGQPIAWLAQRPDRVFELARELGISYFVIFDSSLVAALRSRPDLFEEVYAEPPFHVFKTATFNAIADVAGGEVLQFGMKPNLIAVRYRAANSSVLRVRQVFYPGWRAYIDGREVAVGYYYPDIPSYVWVPGDGVIANYRVPFIEVDVPPGEHEVVLKYSLTTWGDAVSAATLIALSILGVGSGVRKLTPPSRLARRTALIAGRFRDRAMGARAFALVVAALAVSALAAAAQPQAWALGDVSDVTAYGSTVILALRNGTIVALEAGAPRRILNVGEYGSPAFVEAAPPHGLLVLTDRGWLLLVTLDGRVSQLKLTVDPNAIKPGTAGVKYANGTALVYAGRTALLVSVPDLKVTWSQSVSNRYTDASLSPSGDLAVFTGFNTLCYICVVNDDKLTVVVDAKTGEKLLESVITHLKTASLLWRRKQLVLVQWEAVAVYELGTKALGTLIKNYTLPHPYTKWLSYGFSPSGALFHYTCEEGGSLAAYVLDVDSGLLKRVTLPLPVGGKVLSQLGDNWKLAVVSYDPSSGTAYVALADALTNEAHVERIDWAGTSIRLKLLNETAVAIADGRLVAQPPLLPAVGGSGPKLFSVTVRVVDDSGIPVPGALVCANSTCATTALDGATTLRLAAGRYTLSVSHPSAVALTSVLEVAANSTVPLTLTRLYSLHVRAVLGEGGYPPKCSLAILNGSRPVWSGAAPNCSVTVRVPRGVYTIVAQLGGFEIEQKAEVSSDTVLLIPLKREVKYNLSVEAVDESGARVANSSIAVLDENGSVLASFSGGGTLTVGPGRYTIRASAPGYVNWSATVEVSGSTRLRALLTRAPKEEGLRLSAPTFAGAILLSASAGAMAATLYAHPQLLANLRTLLKRALTLKEKGEKGGRRR